MFGRRKLLAATVAYLPVLMVPAFLARWIWRSSLTDSITSPILSVLWLVTLVGTVWFVRLIKRHPTMNPYTKTHRIGFLTLGAIPFAFFPVFYLVTAPLVFRALAEDPNAPRKTILHLDDAPPM